MELRNKSTLQCLQRIIEVEDLSIVANAYRDFTLGHCESKTLSSSEYGYGLVFEWRIIATISWNKGVKQDWEMSL